MSVAALAAGKQARRIARRKLTSRIMLGLCAAAALLAVTPLLWIIGYVILQGAPAINLDFLTQLPTPVGVEGGGIANAIVGSFMVVGLGVLLAAPVGLLGGLYAAARPDSRLGVAIRFATDTLAGVPSIVMGLSLIHI